MIAMPLNIIEVMPNKFSSLAQQCREIVADRKKSLLIVLCYYHPYVSGIAEVGML